MGKTIRLSNVLYNYDGLVKVSHIRNFTESNPYSFWKRFRRGGIWRVEEDITVYLSNGLFIRIPAGFETDFSSVPAPFWGLFPPYGNFLLAALIHDYLYVNQIVSRKFADKEMLIWSNVLNKNKFDNYTRYYMVRCFGWTWRRF